MDAAAFELSGVVVVWQGSGRRTIMNFHGRWRSAWFRRAVGSVGCGQFISHSRVLDTNGTHVASSLVYFSFHAVIVWRVSAASPVAADVYSFRVGKASVQRACMAVISCRLAL